MFSVSAIIRITKKAKKGIQHKCSHKLAWVAVVGGFVFMSVFPVLAALDSPILDGQVYGFLVPLVSTIGGISLGWGGAYLLFQREFEKDMRTDMEKLHKDVGVIDNDVGKLHSNVGKLGGDVSKIDTALKVSDGAVDSGVGDIYATRDKCLEEIKITLEEALASIKQGKRKGKIEISLLGISLGAFLTPDPPLGRTFQEVLSNKAFKIKLAILEDGCKAACCRARVEEESRYESWDPERKECKDCKKAPLLCRNLYQNATCHTGLKGSMDYLQKLIPGRPIEPNGWQPTYIMKAELEARTYKILPMVFMFHMDDHMFVEQYHLGSRERKAPILHIHKHIKEKGTKPSQLFQIFEDHFNSVFAMGNGI